MQAHFQPLLAALIDLYTVVDNPHSVDNHFGITKFVLFIHFFMFEKQWQQLCMGNKDQGAVLESCVLLPRKVTSENLATIIVSCLLVVH